MRLPAQLLHRKTKSHKGDFGHIFILAGSLRYSGAGILCSYAAIRSGAGLVTLAVPKSLANALIKIKPPEIMLLPVEETKEKTFGLAGYKKIKDLTDKIDVVVIGPGLTENKSTQELIRKIITTCKKSKIIDADGLNAVNSRLNILKGAIITPHPGEMSRLLGISIKKIEKTRKIIAKKFACDYNTTVVLKGKDTVVADNKGNVYINKTGNPGMATAGSGDVLTGIIAGFLAQGLNSFQASKFGVYLHGLAGNLAAKEKTQMGMIASDIIEKIPEAIKKCG